MVTKFSGKTVAAIIEYKNGKILLERRNTIPFRGFWALPGGKLERGEKPEEAVIREVREETGLNVKLVAKIGVYEERGLQDDVEYNYHATCFHVIPVGGKIKPQPSEVEEIRKFELGNIPKKLAFRHKDMLHDFLILKGASKKLY